MLTFCDNRPVGVSCGMGLNAYLAYDVSDRGSKPFVKHAVTDTRRYRSSVSTVLAAFPTRSP